MERTGSVWLAAVAGAWRNGGDSHTALCRVRVESCFTIVDEVEETCGMISYGFPPACDVIPFRRNSRTRSVPELPAVSTAPFTSVSFRPRLSFG